MKRMLQLARARPRFGYRRIGGLLVLEGWRAGLSRVFRLWQREGLTVPQKKRRKRRLGMSANGCHRRRAVYPNDVWCWDFIFDRTSSGSQIKWLWKIDEFTTRECLVLKADRGITRADVIDSLAELIAMRGVPKHIRSVSAHHRHPLAAVVGVGRAGEKRRQGRPTDGCRGAWPASPT